MRVRNVFAKYAIGNGQTNLDTQSYLLLALDMIKSSALYTIASFASPIISLALTPFLTHHLSTTDYGALAVLYTIIDLLTVITQLGLIPAFIRAYNGDYDSSRDRLGVLSASIILLSFVSMLIGILMLTTAPWLSRFLFNSPSFSEPVKLTALVIICENLTVPGISWLRAEKRALLYSLLAVINLLIVLVANIVLVGTLHMGINGALIAKGAGFASTVICTLPIMLLILGRRRSLHLRPNIVRNLLFFGMPTVFSDTAAWILQLSDRYLLSHFGSLAQTASYTVAYTLGGVLSTVIISPFALAWAPVMYVVAKREDAAYVFQLVFRWFIFVLLFAAFALSLLSTIILKILFPPTYYSAEPIIPIIAISTIFVGVYYLFKTAIYIRRKTIFEILFMSVAASANVLLNILLIPHLGAIGAAISTCLASIILISVTYVVSQKIYPIKFEIGLFTISLFIGIAFYIGSSILTQNQTTYIGWSIHIGTLVLYGGCLVLLGKFAHRKVSNRCQQED